MFDELIVKVIVYFSITQLSAAHELAICCHQEESQCGTTFDNSLHNKIQAYSISTVLSSVGFLEAGINESFAESVTSRGNLAPLQEPELGKIASFYEYFESQTPGKEPALLDKYQLFLDLAGKEKFDVGSEPFQSARYLVALRNAATHYKLTERQVSPEPGIMSGPKLERQLQGKFEEAKMPVGSHPFFPSRCFGYGCAKWAVSSALEFADEFYRRLGISPRYKHVEQQLP